MAILNKCKFCCPQNESIQILRSFLPDGYEYTVCNFDGDSSHFKTRLRTSGKNQEYARKWLEDFHMHSKCTMRVERTYPNSGTKNVFKVDLRCQHNTRPRSEKVREKESCKNTDCPAKMGITIKRVVTERKSRSKDPHLPDFPAVIQMDFCHNHALLAPEILKHRSVLPEVKEKILALFRLGHNPATALDMHKFDLLLEHGENFEKVCLDRALLPDPQFCYRLYYKIVRRNGLSNEENTTDLDCPLTSGCLDKKPPHPLSSCENSASMNQVADSGAEKNEKTPPRRNKRKLESSAVDKKEVATQLEEVLCRFCESGGFAGMQLIEDDIVMALCTPLMHRVHRLVKQSGDLVFIDAYGDMEEMNNCRVFMLVTYSPIGPIPLGCLVSTSESAHCLKAALELWKQILPEGCFHGKPDGPDLFFTNDDDGERQSLRSAFPKSRLLVCLSHILQASWTFVWDRKNGIKKDHRSTLFTKVKSLLYSQTAEELEMNYAFIVGDGLVKSYSLFLHYVTHVYEHRHDWSLAYCRHLLPRAGDVSLLWESAMIILKDPIFSRTRSYNPLQVVDFLSRLDTYYERKLIDLSNSRFDSVRLSRFLFVDLPREAYTITQNSENEYEVHNDSKETSYQTDVTLGMCECRTGRTGAPCKHQLLVYRNFPIPIYDCVPPDTQEDRDRLIHLATGQEVEPAVAPPPVQEVVQMGAEQPPPGGEIVIQELEGEDFFLDEAGGCEGLVLGGASQHGQSALAMASAAAMMPTVQVLERVDSQGMVLSHHHHSLLSPLDPRTLGIDQNHELNPLPPLNPHQIIPQASTTDPPLPPPSGNEAPQETTADIQAVADVLAQISTKLKERALSSPQVFRPALGTFLKNLEGLASDSALEYALYSFGKFSKSATPLFKRRIVDNKLVGLQSAGEMRDSGGGKKQRTPPASKVSVKLF